jgi:hypothetical protein
VPVKAAALRAVRATSSRGSAWHRVRGRSPALLLVCLERALPARLISYGTLNGAPHPSPPPNAMSRSPKRRRSMTKTLSARSIRIAVPGVFVDFSKPLLPTCSLQQRHSLNQVFWMKGTFCVLGRREPQQCIFDRVHR